MEENKKRFKYVRTKDGRITHLGQCVVTDCAEAKVLYVSDRLNPLCVREIPYVKQADTIEELCDAAVVEWENDETPGCYEYIDKDVLLALLKIIDGINIYGAIYIKGKGLIYVAKMNEKGEFELL